MKNRLRTNFALLAIGWLGMSAILLAAEDASDLPVEWDSDGPLNVSIEGDIRIVEMQDNVEVIQGTLLISGDRAIFEYTADSNELIRVTVHGSPAQYQQESNNDEFVTGSSETIILYEDEATLNTMVEMIGNASIRTPDSVTNCAGIIYDADLSIIPNSTPPCSGSFSSAPN